jgi:hypothetical protein
VIETLLTFVLCMAVGAAGVLLTVTLIVVVDRLYYSAKWRRQERLRRDRERQ